MGIQWYRTVILINISLMSNELEYFSYVYWSLEISFVKCVFQSFAHFSIQLSV